MSKKLRKSDDNKAHPWQVTINYQGQAKDTQDNAPKEFFSKVDSTLLEKPSFSQFIAMMDNFNRKTGSIEPRVPPEQEKREISTFLTTILATRPWQTLYSFLNRKGHPYATNPSTFRNWIEQLWFAHYSRSKGKADSSAFEHVFMGEESYRWTRRIFISTFPLKHPKMLIRKRIKTYLDSTQEKNGEVSGLHNWVRFYMLERNRTEDLDYKGYIVQRGNVMAALRFTWQNALKRAGSLLIGTSPEYDMALYTLCFLSRRGKELCQVELDGCPLSVTSYEMVQNNKIYIGTVFPTAGKKTSTCGKE
ncbi:endoribonuclease XendoU [Ancylostoma caninum]|uniref:Endoribonuclease XendoU n=1 Tax=Ancylostoma caninum TaxID=29170 RepID=A0A368H699_ANCCA|nr:endoribonuclease XendoU [Ancylostoma caninum]